MVGGYMPGLIALRKHEGEFDGTSALREEPGESEFRRLFPRHEVDKGNPQGRPWRALVIVVSDACSFSTQPVCNRQTHWQLDRHRTLPSGFRTLRWSALS